MCYSAQIWAEYKRYVRDFGAALGIKDYYNLFWRRKNGDKIRLPKAMEAAFAEPTTDLEREIKSMIDEFSAAEATRYEQEIFKQRRRLADAERTLQTKTTKAALESQRIARTKVDWGLAKLAELRRTELIPDDSRIYPMWHAPVMVMEEGRRIIKPMRYHLRSAGKPASIDVKFPGLYNARRDNLQGYWAKQFGFTHGVVVLNAFYENVNRHRAEGRELAPGEDVQNLVLEFRPRPEQLMLGACLWSRWTGPDEELLSFALITDEPPPEVAAAGHDRCIIPIQEANLDAWLNPDPADLAALHRILDERDRPYYEHRLAA